MPDHGFSAAPENKPKFSDPLSLDPDIPDIGLGRNRPYDEKGDGFRYSASQSGATNPTDNNVALLKEDLTENNAGMLLLKDVDYLRNYDRLNPVLQSMEKSGDVEIMRDKDGQMSELIFKGDGGLPRIELNLQDGSINGQSKEDLRAASAKEAKDYLSAKLGDPNFRLNGSDFKTEVPEDGRKGATDIMKALIDNDQDALAKAASEILKDPKATADCKEALSRMTMSPVRIGKNSDGEPVISIDTHDVNLSQLQFDKDGNMTTIEKLGNYDYGNSPESGDTSLLRASNNALRYVGEDIERVRTSLEMFNELPADGHANMALMVGAYYEHQLNLYM